MIKIELHIVEFWVLLAVLDRLQKIDVISAICDKFHSCITVRLILNVTGIREFNPGTFLDGLEIDSVKVLMALFVVLMIEECTSN